ncbi:hypothetical protein ABZ172_13235 [Streptomyces sp. NPDC006296]|uniref:hypothetical protein n=1 Tax=Streptomyces sp. NPDC006296 TaxID=3156746 RepID=UPI0033B6FAC1
MTTAPAPCAVSRSPEGDGITVREAAHCRLRAARAVRGLPDEAPDEPLHLSLNADQVFRTGGDAAAPARERPHVMPSRHR